MRILRRQHLQKIQNAKSQITKGKHIKKLQNKINNAANSINQSRTHSSSFNTLNNSSQPNILGTGARLYHEQTQTHSDADKRMMASCTYSHHANTKSLVSTHKTRIKPRVSSFCPRAIFPTSCHSHQHHHPIPAPQDPITYKGQKRL